MNTKEKTYEIVDGPSRDRIYDAIKYVYEMEIPTKFVIVEGYSAPPEDPNAVVFALKTRDVIIHQIQHNSGTGFDFKLEGSLDAMPSSDTSWHPYTFQAYYNAKSRKGNIRLFK